MSLIQTMGMGLLRLLARQTPASASAVTELAMRFVSQSRTAEALSILEAYARLTPEAYADPALLARYLRDRLAKDDAASAVHYSILLSWLLGLEGRRDDSRSVLEASLGLDAEGPDDPARLVARIRERLEGAAPDLVAMMILGYANLLGTTGRDAEGLAVLEADLGVPAGAEEGEFTAAIHARVESLSVEAALLYAGGLANTLEVAGREEEAAWVFKALGAAPSLQLDPQDLESSVRSFLASISPNTAASFLFHFTGTLDSEEMGATRLALLEEHLDLRAEDYRNPVPLAAKLEAKLAGVLPGTASNYKRRLAAALESQGRLQDALALFRADTGLAEEMKEQAAGIGAALRVRLEAEIPKDMALMYVSHVADTLIRVDQAEQAVTLLEGYAGLRPDDYSGPRAMAHRLERLLEEWREDVTAIALHSLLSGLLELDEKEKAGLVAEAFVNVAGDLKERREGDHSSLTPLLAIHEIWLERFQRDPERRPLEVCRDLVVYLRQSFATYGAQLKDRAEFIEVSGDLRRRILETGLFWADQEDDPELSGRIASEVQLWDAELSQRLLMERFLLEPIRPVPPGAPPVRAWAWRGMEMEEPESASHLPDPALARRAADWLDERGGGLRPRSGAVSETPTRLQKERSSLFERAQAAIVKGVDEAKMAELLGDRGLLLRGSFGEEGRLRWFALRSDGRRIRMIEKWSGAPGDLERLRWAAARHDFRMALVRFRARTRLRGTLLTTLREVRQALDELLFELGPPPRPGFLKSRLQWLSTRFLSPWYWDTPRLLLPVLGALQPVPDWTEGYDDWARETAARLRSLRDSLSQPAPRRLPEELDGITAEYIEEARQALGLDRLAPALSPDLDLVVQLDDTLHTVPFAHLPVAGEPLFRRVRSVRSSITLLMTALQLETEKEVGQDSPASERLLSVSHFQAGDRARQGALWLQHGFSVLAGRCGLQAFAAADEPAGSLGLLRTALDDLQRFRVLAVCGHGSLHSSGIALKQDENDFGSLWQGDGCDLSGVEWLWMVSCSIGRLQQSGDLDVEGFCVRLALHRARSVAAFRWPVGSVEAVALVNESVRLYLEALRNAQGADLRCLRARALNDARKSFFGDGAHPPLYPHVGLNTAAACELFGLG
jgi:hypothetical protein